MSPSKVIGYTRVSTADQAANGNGLDVQRARISAWAKFQDLPEPVIFEDAGVSGVRDDRPQFRAALKAALEAGSDAVLVTYKLDRLGRDAITTQEVLALLTDAGVRVVSVADGLDTASGMGASVLKLITTLLAAMSAMERETIRTRLLDGRRRADEANRVYGSEPRYGRRAQEDGTLIVDDAEQAVLWRARELRAEGYTLRGVAAILDEEGHRPRRGAAWNHVVVGRLVSGRPPAKRKGSGSNRLARLRAELLG
jgi:DNA invertase Pin-like site-specific DNA recombinase